MPLYSISDLKNIARSRGLEAKQKLFTESRQTQSGFDIFLSHSFLDKEAVEGLYLDLTDLGFKVYVDWIVDGDLDRSNVTKQTAELIRSRMKQSKSLVLAISTNATLSKWMPWELGYVDGRTQRCAIIPVSELGSERNFERQEYLKLYPFIKKLPLDNTSIYKLWIIDEAYTYSIMEEWLRTGNLTSNRTVNIFNL